MVKIQGNISIHPYIGCLYEIEIQIFQKYANLIQQKKGWHYM